MFALGQWRVVYLADHGTARNCGHHSSSRSSINPWLSTTLPFCDRHVDAGAVFGVHQLDGLRHGVGIFAAVLHSFEAQASLPRQKTPPGNAQTWSALLPIH